MNRIKNVLILCDAFPPAFAPRMGYLCKYLADLGWNPIIITEYLPQNIYNDLAGGQNVICINYYFSKNKIWEKIKYVFVFFANILFNYKDFIIKRKASKIIQEKKIDLILVSSYRIFPALAAYTISQTYKIPFIMDLRDIIEQFPNNEYISKKTPCAKLNKILSAIITKKILRQRNKVLKNADVVTTVSGWHADILSKYNKNVQLIYNGFDPDLFYPQQASPTPAHCEELFVISYTGRIESREIKDPSLLFEAVAGLSAKKKIDVEKFKIRFYLTDEKSKEVVKKLAQKHKITEFITISNAVQNAEIPQILNESSILLLLANKATGENSPKGIMGTKLFEYLAVEKPVLCVRNDEDCLEKTIHSACAGLAASTVEETEKFLLEKYAEWQQNGYTHQAVNREFVQQFSRKRQAEQFVELFNKLLWK